MTGLKTTKQQGNALNPFIHVRAYGIKTAAERNTLEKSLMKAWKLYRKTECFQYETDAQIKHILSFNCINNNFPRFDYQKRIYCNVHVKLIESLWFYVNKLILLMSVGLLFGHILGQCSARAEPG